MTIIFIFYTEDEKLGFRLRTRRLGVKRMEKIITSRGKAAIYSTRPQHPTVYFVSFNIFIIIIRNSAAVMPRS